MGPCKSHRTESPRGLAETPGGEEAQGEEGPAAAPLDVLRLRSSSMEIREKGSEFLKEELHKAQKVGAQRAAGGAAGTRGLSGGAVGSPWAPREIVHLPGPAARRPVLGVREAQKRVLLVTFEGLLEVLTSLKAWPKL